MSEQEEATTDDRMARGTVALEGDREMVAEREFNAPRRRVFDAFHDPALLPRWWGPAGLTTTVERYETRPGGRWRIVQRAPDGTVYAFRGEFREIDAPFRVVSTFEYEGAPGQVLEQTFTFEERGDLTLVRVRVRFPSEAARRAMVASGMESGMREGWARFDELLTPEGER
ncbi:MAG: SRPBCC family protein [Thermoplasmata archaeon]|nr:SRPBCC family protein [Thermoplasmata archaeon]